MVQFKLMAKVVNAAFDIFWSSGIIGAKINGKDEGLEYLKKAYWEFFPRKREEYHFGEIDDCSF